MVWIVLRAKTRKTHLLTLSLYLLNSLKIKTSPLLKICLTSLKLFPWYIYMNPRFILQDSKCTILWGMPTFLCIETCCWTKSVVFLFHFDCSWFFLLVTKIHCLNGINISEIAPSHSPIIYILEQENAKLSKNLILPLSTVLIYKGTYYWGGKKAQLVTIISGRHPRRVANLFFINAKDKLKENKKH